MVKKSCKSFWSLRGLCVKFFISFSRPALYSRYCSLQVLLKKDGNQNEQQNPKCKQFLVATRQTPENHRCTLCCVVSPPNPVVLFTMGPQSAPRYLGVQNLEPIFRLESVGHGGSLQHVLSGVLAICVETERDTSAGRLSNHESSDGVGRGVFGEKRMHKGESCQNCSGRRGT